MAASLVGAGLLALAVFASPQEPTVQHARGTFTVVITPEEEGGPAGPGRMRLEKTFQGDVQATGAGQMLATLQGQSGAYVAMERVEGTVNGRAGGFALVHRGLMDEGRQDLTIAVVPGSGSGELAGITGVFHLTIEGGEHRYDLEYRLPEAAADAP